MVLAPEAVYHFRNSFCPDPWRLAYYGCFFLAGAWLARRRTVLDDCVVPWYAGRLWLCLPLFLGNGLLLQSYLEGRLTWCGRLALGTLCALLASLGLFGLLGLAQRLCRQERPWLRFLADASYWVYLIHLPLVGLGHLLLVRFPGLAPVKFCAVAGAVMAFGLWTYQRLVRGRGLGRLLNGTGTRKERQQGGAPGQEHLPAAA